MRCWQKIAAGVGGVVVVLATAAYGYHQHRMANRMKLVDELPVFVDPAPGPRAPDTRGLSWRLGTTGLPALEKDLAGRAWNCRDTSIRALMNQAREAKRRELQVAEASGAGADSVSGASMIYRRSPKERNPQVRLSCEDIEAATLGDRTRAGSRGRLLFVFDSPRHPLRHVSYARSFSALDDATALQEFMAAAKALTARFGPPREQPPAEPSLPLPLYKPHAYAWKYADLQASVRLMNMGDGRLNLEETVEVPWPVRAEAPGRTLGLAAAAPSP